MPAAAPLPNATPTAAFTLPGGTLGFVIWNESAANLRLRIGRTVSDTGDKLGVPLPGGSTTAPAYFTHYFNKPLKEPKVVQMYQASGGTVATGIGYEFLND